MKNMTPQSAYIHIPFCERKCAYCDFVSYAGQFDRKDKYVQSLVREIELTAEATPKKLPLSTVYFGGGTPTTFSPEQLAEILQVLRSVFGIDADAEVTLEMNPQTVDPSSLRRYADIGFNRASIGVQSLSDHLLSALGRIHTASQALDTIREAGAAGFHNLNCDLMIGLPGQTLSDAMDSLNRLIELNVTHISFYSLSLEEGTPFYKTYHGREELLPSPESEREMYHSMLKELIMHGYQHYEISNCAKPGFISRHNMVYWKALPYYGFGCGAHAYLQGRRFGKTSDLNHYLEKMNSGSGLSEIIEEDEKIDKSESEREFMLLGFRLTTGVSEEEFGRRFGVSISDIFAAELSELLKKNLIIHADGRFFLSEKGIDFANEVFRAFVS